MPSPMDANLSYLFLFLLFAFTIVGQGAKSVYRVTSVHKETDSLAQAVFSALLVSVMRSACLLSV